MLYYRGSYKGSSLASNIQGAVVRSAGFLYLGIVDTRGYTVIDKTDMPAVITETGYMSSNDDMPIILNKRDAIATGIVNGIKGYYP
ncbi:MAG: N-acetylmuramoyl-L-alanine amidase [Actinomycetia bacterium]|nr:N-acetylmuramoyl-L-alanine amidase [Actinomycetes bacterium]